MYLKIFRYFVRVNKKNKFILLISNVRKKFTKEKNKTLTPNQILDLMALNFGL